ncbi:SRPBCC domain-containing protein [Vibrio fluvialis]|nr:SRPBCC domain-containing protein [Vibrio fluvialis]
MKITVEQKVAAPLARVWHAYTTPEDIVHWNAASDDWHTTKATVDLQVGGEFCSRMEAKDGSMGFDFAGVYTHVEPESLIVYEFGDRKADVTFTVHIDGVLVRVTFDAETTHSIEQQREGWQAILASFARYVEHGGGES